MGQVDVSIIVTQQGNVAMAIIQAAGMLGQGRRLLQAAPGAASYPSGPPQHMPCGSSLGASCMAHALPGGRRRCQGWVACHGRGSLLAAWEQRQQPPKGECRLCCRCLQALCVTASLTS